jgi:heterodisulfide reductase subunit B2
VNLGYYPGCSLHGTGKEYGLSTRAVAGALGVVLEEVRDWSCCGATSAHATNHLLSVALPARNLAIAREQGVERVLTPCAACYNRLATARHEMQHDAVLAEKVRAVIGRSDSGSVPVVSVVELLRDLAPALRQKVVKPLKGLKIACYYGCLLVRPPEVTGWDDPEDPSAMESVVTALGATPVRWAARLECCGAGFSLSRVGSVVRLGRAILESAQEAGADVVAVACPMCQSNLDFRQKAMEARSGPGLSLPVVYLTQLVATALGLPDEVISFGTHYVDPRPVISAKVPPATPAPSAVQGGA